MDMDVVKNLENHVKSNHELLKTKTTSIPNPDYSPHKTHPYLYSSPYTLRPFFHPFHITQQTIDLVYVLHPDRDSEDENLEDEKRENGIVSIFMSSPKFSDSYRGQGLHWGGGFHSTMECTFDWQVGVDKEVVLKFLREEAGIREQKDDDYAKYGYIIPPHHRINT